MVAGIGPSSGTTRPLMTEPSEPMLEPISASQLLQVSEAPAVDKGKGGVHSYYKEKSAFLMKLKEIIIVASTGPPTFTSEEESILRG